MNPISKNRGIVLMSLFIIFFAVNTAAVPAIALALPACSGWKVTRFRGIAGTIVVESLYPWSGKPGLKPLIARPKISARGFLGATGVAFYNITVTRPGAALTLLATMINRRASKTISKKLIILSTNS